jgi:hypothetical protein
LSETLIVRKKFLNIYRNRCILAIDEFPYYIQHHNKTFYSFTELIPQKKKELGELHTLSIAKSFIKIYSMPLSTFQICNNINIVKTFFTYYNNLFIIEKIINLIRVSVLNPLHVQFFKYLSMIQLDYRIYRIN